MFDKSQSIGRQIGAAQEHWLYQQASQCAPTVHKNVRLETPVDGVTKEADVVVGPLDNPDIVIESKYLRRSKQARERAYQLVTAADLFQEMYDTTVVAVLTGEFTSSAVQLCEWGLDSVYVVDFDTVQRGLLSVGVDVDWDNDSESRDDTLQTMHEQTEAQSLETLGEAIFEHTNVDDRLVQTHVVPDCPHCNTPMAYAQGIDYYCTNDLCDPHSNPFKNPAAYLE